MSSYALDLVLPRVAAGETGAVSACLDRFGGLVWSLARRMTPTDSEAEDAVQEIFIDVWKSASRYDPAVASEAAFVATIARRRLIDRRRRTTRRPEVALDVEISPPVTPDGTGAPLQQQADVARAMDAFERLSEDQQKVLRLSIFQGLSHDRISRVTGMPLGTVKTHSRRGLIKLRDMLAGEPTDGSGGAP